MRKASLYTRAGDFVAEIQIPPLNPPAEVVFYGSRIFVTAIPSFTDSADLRYREGVAWYALEATLQESSNGAAAGRTAAR